MNEGTVIKSIIEVGILDIIECLTGIANSNYNLLAGQSPKVAITVINEIQDKLHQFRKIDGMSPKAVTIVHNIIEIALTFIARFEDGSSIPESSFRFIRRIKEIAKDLREHIGLYQDSPGKIDQNTIDFKIATESVRKLEDQSLAALALLQDSESKHRAREAELLTQFDALEDRLKSIEKEHENTLGAVKNLFDVNKLAILKKQKDIDALFGIASGSALAGGYDGRARKEEVIANILRIASLILMVVIIALFSWSLYDTTQSVIDWRILLFKFVVSVMLSVPAAYLAKESTRHRQEHQYYLSKALDINAIDPYIANLPDPEKHKLKSKIALRLFAARREAPQEPNEFPINAQEIILKLIEKTEIKIEPSVTKIDEKPAQ